MLCNKLLTLNHDNNLGNADKSKYLEYSVCIQYSILSSISITTKTGIQCGFHYYHQSQITFEIYLSIQY